MNKENIADVFQRSLKKSSFVFVSFVFQTESRKGGEGNRTLDMGFLLMAFLRRMRFGEIDLFSHQMFLIKKKAAFL